MKAERYVRCGGVDLPACIHPDGCDEPQAPNAYVCREHMPPPLGSLDEVAARIGEFRVAKRGNGWSVEHWTGCTLSVPVDIEYPWLGGTSYHAWMVPRWVAEEALATYAQGRMPGPYVQDGKGGLAWPPDSAADPQQPTLFDGGPA